MRVIYRRRDATSLIVVLLATGWSRQEPTTPVYPSAGVPECSISARPAGADIVVTVTMWNHSQSAYRLLEWNLPQDGKMTSPLFEVTRDGTVLEYRGPMVKRAVTAESYLSIPPGRSLSTEIALRNDYDVQGGGKYAITYQSFNQRIDLSGIDTLKSNAVAIVKH
jgi:hypothetical protein